MKKIVSLTLAAAMLASLAACSGANGSEPPKEPENLQSKVDIPAQDPKTAETGKFEYGTTPEGYTIIENLDTSENVTLTMAGWEGGPSETDNINEALELFNKYYPNIKVEYTPSADSGEGHHGKIMTMYSAGTAPDVFYLGSGYVHDFADKGIVYDITDAFSEAFTLDDYIPVALSCMQYKDRLYGITSCNVSPELYYNKDLFDAAGVPYPPTSGDEAWTWDEFVDAAKKLTIQDDNGKIKQYGFYGLEDAELLTAYFYQYGMDFVNEDATKFTGAEDENMKNILQNIKDLRTVHGVSPQAAFTDTSGMNNVQMLLTGMVAMFTEGSWGMEETAESGVNFGVTALPVMPGGKTATWGQAHIHSIVANTKHFDEAWALLMFLGSDTYQLNLVKEGLWTPNKASCYTEESVNGWLTDNHPEGYKDFITYYSKHAYLCPQTVMGGEAFDIFKEECQNYFDADMDLDTVVDNMGKRIDPVLAK